MIDFDEIDLWKPELSDALRPYIPESNLRRLVSVDHKDPGVALDSLFCVVDRQTVIDEILEWIRTVTITAYHGTRLIDAEVRSIEKDGLLPLDACDRRVRLERALSQHKCWSKAASKLDNAIWKFGSGNKSGNREKQVHFTLSRNGLTKGFNHYLSYGSEFDQRVAEEILGDEGKKLLGDDGEPRLIKVAIPGADALDAGHSIFTVDDLLKSGEVPNIVREFLGSWVLKVVDPEFQCRTLEVDCGMIFKTVVPPSWIVNIETGHYLHESH